MIIFAGPSLANVALPGTGIIEIRPPVRQGDVYLATLEGPSAIGIIDGYFDGVPSVWHKEILWAMSQGIAVLGASSMGALRAAELDAFGMIGIGSIYGDYRDGVLEDDDEVALTHGPEEFGFAPLSVAMVNLRATLAAAVLAQVITQHQAHAVIDHATAIFFKDRTWDKVLRDPEVAEPGPDHCQNLLDWIAENEVDQKRDDACLLLDRMVTGQFQRPVPDFLFEQTDLWVHSTQKWQERRKEPDAPEVGGYRLLGDTNFFS